MPFLLQQVSLELLRHARHARSPRGHPVLVGVSRPSQLWLAQAVTLGEHTRWTPNFSQWEAKESQRLSLV